MDEKTYQWMGKRVCEYQALNATLVDTQRRKKEIAGLKHCQLNDLSIEFNGCENTSCFNINEEQFGKIKEILINRYDTKITELEKEIEDI